jgi:hypothetical protein
MCPVLKLPEVTIHTIHLFINTCCRLLIYFVDILDGVSQAMCLRILPPSVIFNDIVNTLLASMADRLKCVATEGADTR